MTQLELIAALTALGKVGRLPSETVKQQLARCKQQLKAKKKTRRRGRRRSILPQSTVSAFGFSAFSCSLRCAFHLVEVTTRPDFLCNHVLSAAVFAQP